MRRAVILTFFILFTLCQSFANGELRIMESLSMQSRILGQEVKFSVCLPVDYYEGNQSYPVVYLLHGLGDDETSWLEYGRISQYADWATEKDSVVPMIFIMPEGYTNYYVNDYKGSFLYQDMFVKELVPYIDSLFRTIADRQHRGLMGYSMGGFGALVLHLKHPDVFGSAVPLSISVRTDEQYKVEYAPEWDEQWGRLFGAQGIVGEGRITDYYKQNSPFHIIPDISSSEYNKYRIYIDNGDKEQTLCRSNEELHILMRNLDFPHEFRVREGGHSFSYWCSALPNSLRFISDAFEGRTYRGDIRQEKVNDHPVGKFIRSSTIITDNEEVLAFVPNEFNKTSRLYPALYWIGSLDTVKIGEIVSRINMMVRANEIGPMVVLTIPENMVDELDSIMPLLEDEFRLRNDYHFRSIIGYRENATQVCDLVINRIQFSSCVLIDGFLHKDEVVKMIEEMPGEALRKTPLFIVAPDKGNYYEGNGIMHMMFRDKDIKHEYRVVEESGGFEDLGIWGFGEIIRFVATNFHR
jgi:enterochelin esterase-like enzyme